MAAQVTQLSRGQHHDWGSEAYVDSWLASAQSRQAQRSQHFSIICGLLPFAPQDRFTFLDVGAGAGAVTQAVLEAFPNSSAVCLDGSEVMLGRARDSLAAYQQRARFVHSDFSRRGWSKPLGGELFQAVVSYQAIHNLFDGARIRGVYREVCAHLAPGGIFVTGDDIDAAPGLQERIEAAHQARKQLRRAIGQVTLESGTSALGRFAGYLEEHFRWLRRAGFSAADCPWRELYMTMLIARK